VLLLHLFMTRRKAEEVEMAVSDQLTKLAARAKEAEDRAAAAQGKASADLEKDVEAARTSAQAQADKLRATAEEKKGKLPSGGTTCSVRGTSTSRASELTSRAGGQSTIWNARR
jgi:hypothetical protein